MPTPTSKTSKNFDDYNSAIIIKNSSLFACMHEEMKLSQNAGVLNTSNQDMSFYIKATTMGFSVRQIEICHGSS